MLFLSDQTRMMISNQNWVQCPWNSPDKEDIIPHLFEHFVLKTTLSDEGVLRNGDLKECGLGLKLFHLRKKKEIFHSFLSIYLDFKLLNHEVCLGQVLIGTLAVVGIESERKRGFSRPFNFLHKNRIWLGTKVILVTILHSREEKYPWNHHRPHSLIISSRLLLLHIAIGHPRNNGRKCRSICKKKISSNKFHQTIYQSNKIETCSSACQSLNDLSRNTFPSNLEQHV